MPKNITYSEVELEHIIIAPGPTATVRGFVRGTGAPTQAVSVDVVLAAAQVVALKNLLAAALSLLKKEINE